MCWNICGSGVYFRQVSIFIFEIQTSRTFVSNRFFSSVGQKQVHFSYVKSPPPGCFCAQISSYCGSFKMCYVFFASETPVQVHSWNFFGWDGREEETPAISKASRCLQWCVRQTSPDFWLYCISCILRRRKSSLPRRNRSVSEKTYSKRGSNLEVDAAGRHANGQQQLSSRLDNKHDAKMGAFHFEESRQVDDKTVTRLYASKRFK